MDTISQQIGEIEKEIRETPHHKGTERHLGILRARIAKLKDRQIEGVSKKTGGGGGYAVKKQGDATVVLVGPPSAGKSTLINQLTNAESKVAPYAFTTVSVIPGMLKYNDAYIQILDVPGLIEGARRGKGRGREVLSVVRNSDLLVLITDPKRISAFEIMQKELEASGIRINKLPPQIKIDKKIAGGIIVHTNIRQEISEEEIADIAREFGIKNAEITIREKVTTDRLIDSFATSRVYVPAILVVNKSDMLGKNVISRLSKNYVLISAENGSGVAPLKEKLWEFLGFYRIYLVKPNEKPSMINPTVVKSNMTLLQVAQDIGTEFASSKTEAEIWGPGAKFPGQTVSLSAMIKDGMMVRFV